MEINKFYLTSRNYVKLFFLIYNGKGIGVEFNSKTGEYITDFWEDVDNSLYHTTWPYKADLTQPRRDVVKMIFKDGNKYL